MKATQLPTLFRLKSSFGHAVVIAAAAVLFAAGNLHAQATRTWVSGVGDDANPGSRTAPCKTFAGAISKTAAGGEISVLDPGGYGAVTITKSMTISGDGTLAAILASGTHGITINAGPTDVVIIRNVSIKNPGGGIAAPSSLYGIRILQAGAVHIDHCTIDGGTDSAIYFAPANAGAKLFVTNSTIYNCAESGVRALPAVSGNVTVSDTHIEKTKFGVRGETYAKVTVTGSVITDTTSRGIVASTNSQINVINTTVANAGDSGVQAINSGIIRIAGSSVLNSTLAGLGFSGSAQIISLGDNTVEGNNPDGAPSSVVAPK